ncbi:MAG: hypothetical protein NTX88_07170 [Candidatus Atribacteria bacterium]|nr:hypothetical protein [Candidatus Atribacteria bacterium]
MRDEFFTRTYRIHTAIVKICTNSLPWLERVDEGMLLPEDNSRSLADIKLSLLVKDPEAIQKDIPLPDSRFQQDEYDLLLDHPVHVTIYRNEHETWSLLGDLGIIWKDYRRGQGMGIRYQDQMLDPVYEQILFLQGPLAKLLFKKQMCKIHASGVVVSGRGIIFSGLSGKGKSTAAYALLRRKHRVLSDESILVFRNGQQYSGLSISDVIKIQSEAARLFFPELIDSPSCHKVGEEWYLHLNSLPGLPYQHSAPVSVLAILEKTGESGSYAEKISPHRVMNDFLPITLDPYEPVSIMKERFTFLMSFLNSVQCYLVHFGTDMDQFGQTIERMGEG